LSIASSASGLTVEEQADQLQRLEGQASAAQLAMLRYQLNPHFLFNTLNSISTLVLLKQTEPANAMLSRLSSFLRYTLINEPTAMVPLSQEIETLKLYLEIEKMRFEDRLRPNFEIDPAGRKGAPAIAAAAASGGKRDQICGDAARGRGGYQHRRAACGRECAYHRFGHRAWLWKAESGEDIVSTGVGLANIRDRLSQAFGERHRFETRSTSGGGFIVTIELPLHDATTRVTL
jgi:sensor histidine kinase YesM